MLLAAVTGAAVRLAQASAATATTIRVGLVTEQGPLDDHGFNQLAYQGLGRAERELGVTGRVLESSAPSDYDTNVEALAAQGYDLVVGVGGAESDAIATAARKHPNTQFAIVDVDQRRLTGKPKNVVGILFDERTAGYLVGYLASLTEKRQGGKTISAVGGFKQPFVDRFIAGYKAGALKAVPGTRVHWAYANSWDDQAACKELALSQIAHGSGVVFQIAGTCGLGALAAAREKNVWGIGSEGDQSYLGPSVLASARKRVDVAVFLTIKSLVGGALTGGRNVMFGLDRSGVDLGTISSRASRADVQAVLGLEKDLAAGGTTSTR